MNPMLPHPNSRDHVTMAVLASVAAHSSSSTAVSGIVAPDRSLATLVSDFCVGMEDTVVVAGSL